jgi:hypothetical protein
MKAPSKNISSSLAGQTSQANQPEEVSVSELRSGGPTMTVPGDGKVQAPPGAERQTGGRGEREARKYTGPMRRWGGG